MDDDDLTPALLSYGRIVSAPAADAPRAQAFGRPTEIDLLLRHLDSGHRKSALLLGPSGCGKSAILHHVFQELGGRPDQSWTVLETSTNLLLSGTHYIGEWQTRLQGLIRRAQESQRLAIYCTDLPNLLTAGQSSKSDSNMATSLAPYIESGEVVLLGECTEETYGRSLERAPWFTRLLTVFHVEPQADEAIREVIASLIQARSARLEQTLGVRLTWTLSAIAALQQFGRLYFPGTVLPGSAAQLLDRLVNHLQSGIERASPRPSHVTVDYRDVVQTLERYSGIPSLLLDDSRPIDLNEVQKFFEGRIVGQPAAVGAALDLIALVKAGLADPRKPLGVFLFVGPTGVGKTEMAKAIAEFIFGSAERIVRYDMSEFKDYHAFEKLIGRNATANESVAPGSLLKRIRRQPFSVILLDEIEKAHENVFDLLLQLFDAGRLSDPQGETTDFTQTIIILTSNLGSDLHQGAPLGFGQEQAGMADEPVLQAVQRFFRPELVNRLDRIIPFRPLTREHVRTIAQRELGHVLLRSGITRRQIRIDVDRGVIEILVDAGLHPAYGARPLKRAVERLVLLPIARQLAQLDERDRPALLRLLPAGQQIVLKVVRDRQARSSHMTTEQRIEVTDPARGKTIRLSPKQFQAQLSALKDLAGSLEAICQQQRLCEQKSDLVQQTARVDFWDDQQAARESLSALYRLELLLQGVQQVCRQVDELETQAMAALHHRDPRQLTALGQRVLSAQRQAETVHFSLLCPEPIDRCDAFVVIRAIEPIHEDLVGRLADMYTGWAGRKGFGVKVVHEELVSTAISREVVLLIEGVSIYGLLRHEQGIHEFVAGKTTRGPKQSHFVRVTTLPVREEDSERSAGVVVTHQTSRGKGLRCPKFRQRIVAVNHVTGGQIVIRNGLDAGEADNIAIDLLRAEQYRLRQPAATNDQEVAEQVLRRYALRPNHWAKDLRTGIITHDLADLRAGNLDEFLLAAVKLPATSA